MAAISAGTISLRKMVVWNTPLDDPLPGTYCPSKSIFLQTAWASFLKPCSAEPTFLLGSFGHVWSILWFLLEIAIEIVVSTWSKTPRILPIGFCCWFDQGERGFHIFYQALAASNAVMEANRSREELELEGFRGYDLEPWKVITKKIGTGTVMILLWWLNKHMLRMIFETYVWLKFLDNKSQLVDLCSSCEHVVNFFIGKPHGGTRRLILLRCHFFSLWYDVSYSNISMVSRVILLCLAYNGMTYSTHLALVSGFRSLSSTWTSRTDSRNMSVHVCPVGCNIGWLVFFMGLLL